MIAKPNALKCSARRLAILQPPLVRSSLRATNAVVSTEAREEFQDAAKSGSFVVCAQHDLRGRSRAHYTHKHGFGQRQPAKSPFFAGTARARFWEQEYSLRYKVYMPDESSDEFLNTSRTHAVVALECPGGGLYTLNRSASAGPNRNGGRGWLSRSSGRSPRWHRCRRQY